MAVGRDDGVAHDLHANRAAERVRHLARPARHHRPEPRQLLALGLVFLVALALGRLLHLLLEVLELRLAVVLGAPELFLHLVAEAHGVARGLGLLAEPLGLLGYIIYNYLHV